MRGDRFRNSGPEDPAGGRHLDWRLFKRLLPFMRPWRGALLLAVLLVILITLLDLALPYLTKTAIDRYIVPVAYTTMLPPDMEPGVESGMEPDADRVWWPVNLSRPETSELLARHPDIRVHYPSGVTPGEATVAWIARADLMRLTPSERLLLRQADWIGLQHLALVFLLLLVLSFGANLAQQRLMEAAGQKGMHHLRQHLFAHLLRLPVTYFNHNPVGRLVTRITNDVQNLHELFTSIIVFVFKDLLLLAGISIVLLAINPFLALLCFAVLPVVAVVSGWFARRSRRIFQELRTRISQINTRFAETLAGLRVIQLFGHEKTNYQRFKTLNHAHFQAGMQQVHLFSLFLPIIEILGSLTVAIIIYQGGTSVLAGYLTLGELVIFLAYMKMFFRPVRDITEKHNVVQNALASAERIFQLQDTPVAVEPSDVKLQAEGLWPSPSSEAAAVFNSPLGGQAATPMTDDLPSGFQRLIIDGVSFGYIPTEPVLQDISFTLPAGQTLALVGATGSGKTTLIQLLLRFYTPDRGQIRWDDWDIQDIPRPHLHRLMALVPQEPVLFSESIAANICGGNPPISEERLQEILALAQCQHFLTRLPQGLNTVLGEGGTLISSGERQLIAIARAFARDPRVLIFDEATSYIDSHSEQHISLALANLMHRRTTIIVAHRLATVRRADQILVLKQGRIVERGNHAELMQQQGYYYYLNQLG